MAPFRHPDLAALRRARAPARARARTRSAVEGAWVEEKGATLTLHFRGVRARSAARRSREPRARDQRGGLPAARRALRDRGAPADRLGQGPRRAARAARAARSGVVDRAARRLRGRRRHRRGRVPRAPGPRRDVPGRPRRAARRSRGAGCATSRPWRRCCAGSPTRPVNLGSARASPDRAPTLDRTRTVVARLARRRFSSSASRRHPAQRDVFEDRSRPFAPRSAQDLPSCLHPDLAQHRARGLAAHEMHRIDAVEPAAP